MGLRPSNRTNTRGEEMKKSLKHLVGVDMKMLNIKDLLIAVHAIHNKTTGPTQVLVTPSQQKKVNDLTQGQYDVFIKCMREGYPFCVAYNKCKEK